MTSDGDTVARLEGLLEEQAALRRVATLVARDTEPGHLFDCVCEELGRVLGVESTDILRYENDGTATILGAWAASWGPSFPVGSSVSVEGETVTAKLYRSGRPERVDDYAGVRGQLAARLRKAGIRSVVGAPVHVAGRLWGGIMAVSDRPFSFPEDTERRIADFAELVTAAVANVDAREQLAASRARIVEAGYEERRRLERDLHDGAQQELVGVVLDLRLAKQKLTDAPAEAREHVDEALERAQAGIRDLRELAAGIHPSVLTDRGLGAALESLASRSPLPVEIEAEESDGLPDAVATTAYFVVAEALTNATKYARCDHVEVSVRVEGGWTLVEVRDDGLGGADASAGSGLRGLADRVSALGGRLEVDSPVGEGTTVRARIASAVRLPVPGNVG
jgi:signal transduction histidine kinase